MCIRSHTIRGSRGSRVPVGGLATGRNGCSVVRANRPNWLQTRERSAVKKFLVSVFVAEVVRHFFDYKLWFLLFLFLELFDESYASSKFFEEREGKKRKRFGTMMGTSRKYRIGPQ